MARNASEAKYQQEMEKGSRGLLSALMREHPAIVAHLQTKNKVKLIPDPQPEEAFYGTK